LQEANLLKRFVTSNDGALCESWWLPEGIRARLRNRLTDGVPPDRVITHPWPEILTRVVASTLGQKAGSHVDHLALDFFDRCAARQVLKDEPRIVVGFENSCYWTFLAAQSVNARRVLDAASVHHGAQPVSDSEFPFTRRRVDSRKDAEIALADDIVVLSSYAKQSYLDAGVAPEKISLIPPGAHLPRGSSEPLSGRLDEVRYVFAGNVKMGKGVDLLLTAFSELHVEGKRLFIAGGLAEPGVLPNPLPKGVEYVGKLTRTALASLYATADIFVLPSRADGFGIAVAEAMSLGLPVIVSSAVGAKDYITHGVNGWIFDSGDATALEFAMREAADRRNSWRAMGVEARHAVAGLNWETYAERIQAFYTTLLRAATAS
jgi:glycosyltransferase involved in cell wall biosynthesis